MNASAPPPDPDRLWTLQEVAAQLGISPRKAWRMVATGELPQPVRVGQRGTRFRGQELGRFIRSLPLR